MFHFSTRSISARFAAQVLGCLPFLEVFLWKNTLQIVMEESARKAAMCNSPTATRSSKRRPAMHR